MNKDKVIFWFDSPPKVGKGAFNYVTNNWENEVIYVFNNDFREERKSVNWNDGDFGKAKIIELYKFENQDLIIKSIFNENPHAINIVNGFTSIIASKIEPHILKPGIKLLMMSERPVTMGNFIERLCRKVFFKIKYRLICNKFIKYTNAFLPLGKTGVNEYLKYGWPENKMYAFMYNPQLKVIDNIIYHSDNNPKIRFLYIGRFYYKTKGIDTLMKATKYLTGDWSLDLVGGYGKNAKQVISWASNQSNVRYIGRWNSDEVITNMSKYDVVVVPSKYDGWNLLINESLHAVVGVISTNETVSHEIIQASGAGIVIKANNKHELANAMQKVIDSPLLINQWKINALNFVHNIDSSVVGKYFIDIINYTFYNIGNRPICPWQ